MFFSAMFLMFSVMFLIVNSPLLVIFAMFFSAKLLFAGDLCDIIFCTFFLSSLWYSFLRSLFFSSLCDVYFCKAYLFWWSLRYCFLQNCSFWFILWWWSLIFGDLCDDNFSDVINVNCIFWWFLRCLLFFPKSRLLSYFAIFFNEIAYFGDGFEGKVDIFLWCFLIKSLFLVIFVVFFL